MKKIERDNIFDTMFHLLALESINYILKKQDIDMKQKLNVLIE
jgi:hypothetical protein